MLGRGSVELRRFAFFLNALGVVAVAVLSGRIFRSVAGDRGSYILGSGRRGALAASRRQLADVTTWRSVLPLL
jgi:hypothetical protein